MNQNYPIGIISGNKFAFIILLLGISLTSFVLFALIASENKIAKDEFDDTTRNMVNSLNNRIQHHQQVLTGAKGLFLSSEEVTPLEWQTYIDSQNISETYPGIQAVSYVEHIDRDSINEFLEKMKNNGFENFSIKPTGIRDEYYVVSFISPVNSKNQKAIGFDIYSEETRRNAIDLAVKTKDTTITGKIKLIQEDDNGEKVQSGFLMLMPYYDSSVSTNPKGLFSAVFRMDDLVFSVIDVKQFENIKLKIYDAIKSDDNVLFDSGHLYTNPEFTEIFSTTLNHEIENRNWILEFEGASPYQTNYALFLLWAIIGYSVTVMLFYFSIIFQKNKVLQKRELESINEIKELDEVIKTQEQVLKFNKLDHSCCVCVIDIVGSTKITSKLSDSKTSQLYSRFLNFTSKIVIKHGGAVVKNVGDGILFYFPINSNFKKKEFTVVLDCCLNILESRNLFNSQLKELELPSIDFRISATFGSIIIANLGNSVNPDIFGTTVNKTFKINRLAKTNGLVISDILYEKVKDNSKFIFDKVESDFPTEFSYNVFHVEKAEKNP